MREKAGQNCILICWLLMLQLRQLELVRLVEALR